MSASGFFSLIVVVGLVLLARRFFAGGGAGRAARPGPVRADLSAVQLAGALRSGRPPGPVAASFPMRPGEVCVAVVDADVEQWLEGDGSYTTKHVAWASGIPGLVIGGAVNAIGNSARKSAAAREMAERWRLLGSYRLSVTTQRIAFEGGSGREWSEMWLADVRRIEQDGDSVVVQAVGRPPTRLHAAPGDYWVLLLRYAAFGEVPAAA